MVNRFRVNLKLLHVSNVLVSCEFRECEGMLDGVQSDLLASLARQLSSISLLEHVFLMLLAFGLLKKTIPEGY